jgi:hypothetical protein
MWCWYCDCPDRVRGAGPHPSCNAARSIPKQQNSRHPGPSHAVLHRESAPQQGVPRGSCRGVLACRSRGGHSHKACMQRWASCPARNSDMLPATAPSTAARTSVPANALPHTTPTITCHTRRTAKEVRHIPCCAHLPRPPGVVFCAAAQRPGAQAGSSATRAAAQHRPAQHRPGSSAAQAPMLHSAAAAARRLHSRQQLRRHSIDATRSNHISAAASLAAHGLRTGPTESSVCAGLGGQLLHTTSGAGPTPASRSGC